jgi:GTP cyclohydrolase I
LAELGEDPSREGLLKTPQRAADALLFLTHGYQTDLTSEDDACVYSLALAELCVAQRSFTTPSSTRSTTRW